MCDAPWNIDMLIKMQHIVFSRGKLSAKTTVKKFKPMF